MYIVHILLIFIKRFFFIDDCFIALDSLFALQIFHIKSCFQTFHTSAPFLWLPNVLQTHSTKNLSLELGLCNLEIKEISLVLGCTLSGRSAYEWRVRVYTKKKVYLALERGYKSLGAEHRDKTGWSTNSTFFYICCTIPHLIW